MTKFYMKPSGQIVILNNYINLIFSRKNTADSLFTQSNDKIRNNDDLTLNCTEINTYIK